MRIDNYLCSLLLALCLLPAVPGSASTPPAGDAVPQILETTARQRQTARMVSRFVERAHYAGIRIDDELSALVLDNYIDSLDGNKHYFLDSDIAYFSRYRQTLDDALRSGTFDPVFDIFRLYRLRAQQNLGFAREFLDQEPDFGKPEAYYFDRTDLPWIDSPAKMQDVWRRRVKNDGLSLVMADKKWEEAAEVLDKRYARILKRINQMDSDDVFEAFMNAFARTLDPHSNYLSPRQSEEYRIQMSLSYQGIGASLQLNEDLVTILGIIPGGPASIDGRLQPNDRITAVGQGDDGDLIDVVGWQLDDVVQLIRGPSGSKVRLQILPADALPGSAQSVVELTRNKIKLEEQAASRDSLTIERGGTPYTIGVIDVPSFYQDFDARSRGDDEYISTTRDVSRLIDELDAESMDGLVVDLRGNGGGHLSEATALTGLFIDDGPVVQLKDSNGRIEVLRDPIPESVYDGPLVVLVDRFSASASEIFAAAIQDYRRGIVIGQRTFGKGTVQNLYVLDQYARRVPEPGLGQLTLTIGKYYRVTGGSTQHRGVLPDIDLPSAVDPERVGESSRERALPWDQINATRFSPDKPLDNEIAFLVQSQRQRTETDPDMRHLLSDIEAVEQVRSQRVVSLNLAERKAEREERRQAQVERENVRRAAVGLEPIESLEAMKKNEDEPDALLSQAAELVADLADLASGSGPIVTRAIGN